MSPAIKTKTLPAILLICWLSMNSLAQATDAGVHDDAKMFSADVIRKVDDSLRELKSKTNKTVVIETHRGVPADQRAALRANRGTFYSKWVESRAKELKLNGSLFMIVQETKDDVGDSGTPGFRIEFWTDAETRKRFTNQEADAATAKLKKLFKDDRNQALEEMTASIKTGMMSRFNVGSPLGAAAEKGVINNNAPVNKQADNKKEGTMDVTTIVIYLVVGLLGFWILIGLVRAFTRPRVQPGDYNAPPPPPGMGRGGMAPPGYGQPYGQGYGGQPMGYPQQGGGGMGFMGSLMTGMLGAAAGNYMYDRFFRGGSHGSDYGGSSASTGGGYFGGGNTESGEPQTGYTGGSDIPMDDNTSSTTPGNDYDQNLGGSGDFDGGSTGGGGGGGDFGGGGGDFGGGGGDFGGGGGDFGGGGGGDFSGGGDSGGGDF